MSYVINISNLKMRYNINDDYVLKGIDLKINPGQIIGYIGPNGAGKTTTIKILLSLIKVFEGSVEVNGTDIREDSVNYKYKIGYVPEQGELYENLTGYETLEFFGTVYKVEKSKLEERIRKLSTLFEINESIHERISSYSKGMKQKVLIISSLLHNPDILFFDEPLNGLDANSVRIFKNMIAMLAKEGKTIFYSSHIMDVVEKISDRIILLYNGKIVANGTIEELQQENGDGSLEGIFGSLTGFDKSEEIAASIVEAVRG
jgi:ABC-2 type transport system ATP-binding protein